jgi:RNA-binding protein NOB1
METENIKTEEKDKIIKDNAQKENTKSYMILDTSFFIKLTSLNLDKNNYYTTQYIVNEIRDPKARDFYQLNKNFIEIKNPTKDSIKKVSKFAKESNDLTYLSIADLSIMALAYETIKNIGLIEKLNKKPLNYTVIDQEKFQEQINKKKEKEKNEKKINEDNKIININEDDDEDDWITPENLYTKLDEMNGVHEIKNKKKKEDDKINVINNDNNIEMNIDNNDEDKKNKDEINVYVNTADFTLQNACMKMGIPILGVDGLRIRNIKNYILKCTVCYKFIFEIDKKFCPYCGYPYLMKIGYNIYANGEMKINDRKPEPRKRGQIFDLPAPTTKKNGTVYILTEDQIPKKGFNKKDVDINKILENYESFKELPKHDNNLQINSSKQYKWGFPKKNPNIPKKHYNKKKK